MKTAFVILNYNTPESTINLVNEISDFVNLNAIIVVDNHSTDDSAERLKLLKDNNKVKLILAPKNGGYSYGNNIGMRECAKQNVDIAFIANPDISIKEKDFDLIRASLIDSDYSLLQGVQYQPDGSVDDVPVQFLYTYWDYIRDCFYIGRRIRDLREPKCIDYNKPIQPMTMFRGSCFAIKVKDFERVGGFDEHVFLYCEETILSHKLLEAHLKIGLSTGARYLHTGSESINAIFNKNASRMCLLYKSIYYYNLRYNKIGIVKKIILKLSIGVSTIEFYIKDYIGEGFRRIRK